MAKGKRRDLIILFLSLFCIYNANLRLISAGDCVPARLLPFSILREGNLNLDEFGLWEDNPLPPGPAFFAVLPHGSWQEVPGKREGWLTVARHADSRLRLFVREKEGVIWETTLATTGWEKWHQIPGQAPLGESKPAVVVDQTGKIHLFVQAKDWTIWENTEERGQWRGWQEVPGSGKTPFALAAVIDGEGVVHLVVQGADQAYFYENRLRGQEWQGWRRVVGGRGISGPVVIVDANGKLWLFIYGPDRKVWYSFEGEGRGQGAWQQIPEQPELASFTVVRDAQGRLLLFAAGRDQKLWQNVLLQERWQGWEPLTTSSPLPAGRLFSKELAGVLGDGGAVWLFASAAQGKLFSLPYFVREARGGHVMPLYPVTLPIVITPLYLPAVWLLHTYHLSFADLSTSFSTWLLTLVMEKLSASLIASLSALFVYLALGELCERRAALWLTALYALGTNTWTISSQALWQHGLSELSLSLMVYALLKARQQKSWLLTAGLGAAVATANRPPNVLFALLALGYVWRFHRWRIFSFLPFPLIIGVPLLAYNLSYFGTLTGGYGIEPATRTMTILKGLLSLNSEGLLGILFSPNRGLLLYTPFTLFSLWGGMRLWRSPADPVLRCMSLGVLGQIFFYGKFQQHWWAGYCFGSRFLTDISPFLCLLLIPVLPLLKRRLVRGTFVVAALLSVAVQVTGAFFYAGQWDRLPAFKERLWSWHDTQILLSLKSGLAPTMYLQIAKALKELASPSETAPGVSQPVRAKSTVVVAPLKEFVQELSCSTPVHTLQVNEKVTLPVTVKNPSTETWSATGDPTEGYMVHLSYHWLDDAGTVVVYDGVRTEFPQDLAPGESVSLAATIQAPAEAGEYVLRLTMVQEKVAWFNDKGGQTLNIPVTVTVQ